MIPRLPKYPTPQADNYVKYLEGGAPTIENNDKIDLPLNAECGMSDASSYKDNTPLIIAESGDTPDVPFRPCEKMRLRWSGLTCQYRSVPHIPLPQARFLQIWPL